MAEKLDDVLTKSDAIRIEECVAESRTRITNRLGSRNGLAKTSEDAEDLFQAALANALIAVAEKRLDISSLHYGYLNVAAQNEGVDRKKDAQRVTSFDQPSQGVDESGGNNTEHNLAKYSTEFAQEDERLLAVADRDGMHKAVAQLERLSRPEFDRRPKDRSTTLVLFGYCHKVIDTEPGEYEADGIREIQDEMVTAILESTGLDTSEAEANKDERNAARQSLFRVRRSLQKCVKERGVIVPEDRNESVSPWLFIEAILDIPDDDETTEYS